MDIGGGGKDNKTKDNNKDNEKDITKNSLKVKSEDRSNFFDSKKLQNPISSNIVKKVNKVYKEQNDEQLDENDLELSRVTYDSRIQLNIPNLKSGKRNSLNDNDNDVNKTLTY